METRRLRLRCIARSWLLRSLPAVLVSSGALGCRNHPPRPGHEGGGDGGLGGASGGAGASDDGGTAGSAGVAGAPEPGEGGTGGSEMMPEPGGAAGTAGDPCRGVPEGTPCSDENACNGEETCDAAGVCVPGEPVVCDAKDACHEEGECNPDSGECSYVPGPDGAPCDDGTACTGASLCQAGDCVGANPVVCVAPDVCHDAGECDPETGACSNPEKPGAVCPPLPPDPSTVASPIDPTVATNLGDSTEFLYAGDNPIQTGVTPGIIDRRRAAVIRGRVKTRDGAPLPGVAIAVEKHPELGSTLSRADGYFDLAVNGGGFLTIAYEKNGYLPAQRQVQVPWLDFTRAPDVALVPLDPNVTIVDLTRDELQAARGSWMIDDNGTRRMTLLFKPGTTAVMTLADCTTEPLDVLRVRATEYTVGPNGPSAMPAPLPPTSGYTYAAELSVDEALEAGAERVEFSQPVIGYVDNYRGFAVGTTVPFALFESDQQAWVPSESGRVIAILESGGELADIDTDGDDLADDVDVLSELGVDDGERRFLRENYPATTTLWRVAIPHFSDWNWPIVPVPSPGPGATNPSQQPPQTPTPPDDTSCDDGCIIEIESQTVGESVPIAGTPFSLAYRSDRVLGRKTELRIPVTGSTLPPELLGVDVSVSAAGKVTEASLPAARDQTFAFVWDGLDAYDRPIQGDVRVDVRISYAYKGYFALVSRFGQIGTTPLFPSPIPYKLDQSYSLDGNYLPRLAYWDARGLGLGAWSLNVHHSYDPQSKVLRLGHGTRRTVEGLQPEIAIAAGTGALGFAGDGGPAKNAEISLELPACYGCVGGGGKSSSSGIAVDADGGYYIADVGNCRVRYVDIDGFIETVAGTGFCDFGAPGSEPTDVCGTGTDPLATTVDLAPIEVTVAPDGDVYIVSSPLERGYSPGAGYGIPDYAALGSKIYRLDVATGTLRRVAGNGLSGVVEEDVPATQAYLRSRDVAVAGDGTLYIADTGFHRIRRVGPDGIITTIAGDGNRGFAGDGEPASLARFSDPTGVAVDRDGAVYVADQANGRIRRIRADGEVETIAGGGFSEEDGAAPLDAWVYNPFDVALGPDSTIHYVELAMYLGGEGPNWGRVRKITPEGTIETVAGVSGPRLVEAFDQELVDRQTATSLHILPSDADVAPDGAVYLDDVVHNRVLRVAPPLPGVGVTDVLIPSEDAGEVFVFDRAGRHLRTIDPRTGTPLLSFSYHPTTRRLSAVTDANGNVTAIQRDPHGDPTSITSSFGHVTELGLDANGFLALVRNPAGEAATASYTPGGLLSKFTDPRGGEHAFEWTANGRLIRETNPTGASKTFGREDTNSYEVTRTSALGRESSTFVDGPPQGPNTTVTTHLDGTQTIVVKGKDGATITTTPDGTRRTMQLLPDQRFGTLSPLTEIVVETPGGLLSVTSSSREVILSDQENPLSVQAILSRTVVNGNTFESAYDALSRRTTRTSPEGRTTFETVDEQGRVTRRDVPGLASTFFAYDERGLLESVTRGTPEQAATSGGPRVTTFEYNEQGQLDTVTAPLGQITRFLDYDGAGRARKQVLPGDRTVTYEYDANSNVTSVTPPGRPAHELNYTPLDLLSEYTPPKPGADEGGAWSTAYMYDADKQLELVTRPDSLKTDYRYDDAGRLESLVFPSPITPSVNESSALGYDAAGRLRTLTSPSGVTLTYGYDGPLVVSETWSGAVNGSLARGYDDQFRVISETVAGTPAIAFAYDADGLLSQAGALALTRDASTGLLVRTTLGSLADRFDYDAFGELSGYTAFAPDTSTLFGVTYARDALGRITTKTETISGVTTVHGYRYDAAGRLEAVTKDGVETARYTYDANGNRLSKIVPGQATIDATYDDQDRLIRYGNTTYTYTTNGELLTKTDSGGTTRYSYDVLGNLRRVVLPDETVIEYLVDGRNRRVGKKVNGTLVQAFLYGAQIVPLAELDGSGGVVALFVYGTKATVPEYVVGLDRTFRVIADHLGSPRLLVDPVSGAIVQQIEYDVWGNVLNDTNPGFQPFGFGGGLYDRDTKFVRFGARDYDSASGTWARRDKTELMEETLNLFAYSWQDPVNFADPAGELPIPASVLPSVSPGNVAVTWPPQPVPTAAPNCEQRGGETCTARCPYGPDAPGGIAAVGTVTGTGTGKTKADACAAARQDANNKVPRGMRAKHCNYN